MSFTQAASSNFARNDFGANRVKSTAIVVDKTQGCDRASQTKSAMVADSITKTQER